jgi:hypothetical protein
MLRYDVDSAVASRLAGHIQSKQETICKRVTVRLLVSYPDLKQILKLEGSISAEERLSSVAVQRFSELVRAILVFEVLELADQEFQWAGGVLPRHGVQFHHQSALVRWFFEEVSRLELDAEELALAGEIEEHFLAIIRTIYKQA